MKMAKMGSLVCLVYLVGCFVFSLTAYGATGLEFAGKWEEKHQGGREGVNLVQEIEIIHNNDKQYYIYGTYIITDTATSTGYRTVCKSTGNRILALYKDGILELYDTELRLLCDDNTWSTMRFGRWAAVDKKTGKLELEGSQLKYTKK